VRVDNAEAGRLLVDVGIASVEFFSAQTYFHLRDGRTLVYSLGGDDYAASWSLEAE
jgi:hypothetical protein